MAAVACQYRFAVFCVYQNRKFRGGPNRKLVNGEDESDDESQDPFDADAQLLVPGLSPMPPTNSTFVFPPPDVFFVPSAAVSVAGTKT